VHQLPPTPSNLRVRTWRRLQQLGAIPLKQSVYVLPDSPGAREDFEWLKTEVTSAGGEASVFAGGSIDAWSDGQIVEEFRRTRRQDWAELADDIEQVLKRIKAGRRGRGTRAPAIRRLAELSRERLAALERIDFFGSPGRERAVGLMEQLERLAAQMGPSPPVSTSPHLNQPVRISLRGRLWVTRPRPGVDRMASAWLIRRFIDPKSRFGFVRDGKAAPKGSVPFDMFGVEFTHRGDGCTFETLCATFGLHEPALARLAAIVHDLDLKDARFGAPESSAVGAVIEGLQLAHADDAALLAQGMALFDALYRSFQTTTTSKARPRSTPKARRP